MANQSNSLGRDVVQMAQMVYDVFNSDATSNYSLTGYAKTTSVVSSAYIEESIKDEDVIIPLMQTVNQIYLGYVLTALQLNNVMDSYAGVRNAIRRVSTEDYVDISAFIDEHFVNGPEEVSLEAAQDTVDKAVSHLSIGKMFEFDFVVGKNDKGAPITVKVPINVSILPNAITSNVAQAYLERNFAPSTDVRWKKVKAGELSFFRDFLFARDLTEKYIKAIKEDKSNVLKGMVMSNNKRKRKVVAAALGRTNNNIANSILVIDKRTLDASAHESNFNFNSYKDRQKFFDDSLSIMCVVVDTLYDNVDIYFNSLQEFSTFSFRDLEKAGMKSSGSGLDMKVLMNTIAKGNAPRF